MNTMRAACAVLTLVLAACGRAPTPQAATPVPGPVESAAPPPPPSPGNGYLKVRKIYDWMPAGFPAPNVGPYDPVGQENGDYNYPEPILGGWPFRVTPVDASGNPTGPTLATTTLQEMSPTDGRYLELPAGRYLVEEPLPTATSGGGVWARTGANRTQGGATDSLGVTGAVTVVVTAGTDTAASVVRFFNVCRLGGAVQTFPAAAVADVRASNVSYACKPSFEPPTDAGALDPSFDGDGRVRTEFPGFPERALVLGSEAVVQPDGKIVVAGRVGRSDLDAFALARYNPDGSLDTAFGSGGRVITDVIPNPPGNPGDARGLDQPTALLLQPDGKLVVAGFGYDERVFNFLVIRYNPDGSLDAGFGAGGKVVSDLGSDESARDAALLPDGKIVLVGNRLVPGSGDQDFAVVRYNADGSLDAGFGSGGLVIVDRAAVDFPLAVVAQADGKVVLAGNSSTSGGGSSSTALIRLSQNGSLDPSFGTGGIVSTQDPFGDLLLLPDGKLLTAGSDLGAPVVLARFNPDGSPDAGFGTGGRAVSALNAPVEAAALLPGGKVVTVGTSFGPGNTLDFVVARFNASGSPDAGFGDFGRAVTDFDGRTDTAAAVAVQPDGKIVAVGTSESATFSRAFALARYLP